MTANLIKRTVIMCIIAVAWLSNADGGIMGPRESLKFWTRPGLWVNSDQFNKTTVFSATFEPTNIKTICRFTRTAGGESLATGWVFSSQSGCNYNNLDGKGERVTAVQIELLKEETTGIFKWKSVPRGELCDGAIIGGMTKERETTYVCRVGSRGELVNNWIIPGTFVPSKGKCYIGYANKAESYETYEILYDSRY